MNTISEEEKELWLGSSQKNLTLSFSSGTTLQNSSIYSEAMELEQTLCDEDGLTFGHVACACFKTTVSTTAEEYQGQEMTVTLSVGDYSRQLGVFVVDTDKLTSDRSKREIVAYDKLYSVLNTNYADWYNGLTFPMTMSAFRKSFLSECGLSQETTTLVNDSMSVEQTISPDTLSGQDILESICEINGVFGRMDGEGIFRYTSLNANDDLVFPSDDLYPAETLFPKGSYDASISSGSYVQGSFVYEDFTVKSITQLQIRQEENDIGAIVGEEGNTYIIEDNFLVYGKDSDTLTEIGENLLSQIAVTYTPAEVQTSGMPWLELGDYIRVYGSSNIATFPILHRTLSGISALRDTFEAKGTETYTEDVNGIQTSFTQLKGKTNTLERTIEETKLEIADVEAGLTSTITQTASELQTQITNIQNQVDGKITIWTSTETPTLDNYPASQWTTDTERANHVGDVTYYGDTGYRFTVDEDGNYSWYELSDNDVTKALKDSAEALAKAEGVETELLSYSTTTEMQSAIDQKADEIELSVSKTYATTAYVDTAETNAVDSANATTTSKLKSYSTTTEMNSAISLSASNITSTVASTYETRSDASSTKTSLQSQINQTAKSISLSVSNGSTSSGITITTTKADGTTSSASGTITMSGLVKFTDLSTSGSTTINGANITTGSISCNRLSGGTISGQTISGGTISGSTITCTSGTIGGWTMNSYGIYFNNSSQGCGIWGTTAHANIAIHAGANTSNIGSAPFRVYHDGTLVATNATISGTVTATSGSFSGTIKSSSATITGGTISIAASSSSENRITVSYGSYASTISPMVHKVTYGSYVSFIDQGKFSTTNGNITQQLAYDGLKLQRSSSYAVCTLDGGATTTARTVHMPASSGTLALSSSSDSRIKTNIVDTSVSGLDYIDGIKLHSFKYTDGREHPSWNCGMIAQEMQEYDPCTIIDGSGGENEDGSVNPLCIDSFYLVGYLIKAVQELSAKVKELEEK